MRLIQRFIIHLVTYLYFLGVTKTSHPEKFI